MKTKRLLSIWMTLAIIVSTITIPAMANDSIKVLLNGTELSFDVPPQLIQDRTMVPMRKIFEALGADVEWDGETQKITAILNDKEIAMQIDDDGMFIKTHVNLPLDGSPIPPGNVVRITLDVPPQLVNDRTLVPVRAVAEGLDADVKWDDESQTVIITKVENTVSMPSPKSPDSPTTYNIGSDTIESLTAVVGARNFESVKTEPNPSDENSTMYFYSYNEIENPKQDAEKYRDFLEKSPRIKIGNVGEYANDGEDDTIVIALGGWLAGTDTKLPILIAYSEKEKTVQIIITVASLENINKETSSTTNTKRGGKDAYGYITIPSDWGNFIDAGLAQTGLAHVGFMSLDGFIINLIDHGQITQSLEQVVKVSTLGNPKKTKLDGFEAYQLSSYYDADDIYVYAWYFFDSQNNIRCITAEGPSERIAEAIEIVEKTFSLSK
ncbi:MAG: copper amine oxidase N-terminal domain-containing protein [Eubacteriales bacterium]|nr:copper amine oxidase N-terminal domain-containing protein [Eubacteriales bacterium]